ncbi:RdgB/HAM1 family non-canonical purine NTP pyrophosphatase [Clostridium sp. Cult2]|uniref:RdgB/HAM1 family non-canonical purine NTP pyrophosphatase n=1 Tax=Clostridium sp. Cult2 TaxID=2079003 RepID=UPI001F021CF9|nr:RdgB/HAM1 family non-canonical purine NTP pyrophosphatase [Clostridium sp. Cult2]MCF6465401.1 non-canonical purine NTP pyrophosphatase, RdgB/HAM1 family [Clostridium sp. Cult2]
MTKKRLVLSTGNKHKVEEIKEILKDLPIEVFSKNDLGFNGFEIEENGETLEENAIKKATSLAGRVQGMVMADDTGLFVEYLNGGPGVHSARYSGIDATYEKNNIKLLNRLDGVPLQKRKALFKTVIALVTEHGNVITVIGECKGYIGFEPKGEEGFGYDPLFIVEGYNKTFAELGEEIKNKISHRARALDKLKIEIIKILEDD